MSKRKRKFTDENIVIVDSLKRRKLTVSSSSANFDEFVRAIEWPDNANRVLLTVGPENLRGEDLQTLLPGRELNDVIMNTFLELVRLRYSEQNRLYVLNTYFLPIYRSRGFGAVHKWFKVGSHLVSPFCFDRIIIPVHQEAHWAAIVVDMKKFAIYYFDSCYQYTKSYRNNPYVQDIYQFLHDAYRYEYDDEELQKVRICARPFYEFPKFSLLPRTGEDVPQQENFVDCGVFALMFALRTAQLQSPWEDRFGFDQEDIPVVRTEILRSLWMGHVSGKLLLLKPVETIVLNSDSDSFRSKNASPDVIEVSQSPQSPQSPSVPPESPLPPSSPSSPTPPRTYLDIIQSTTTSMCRIM
jgi:hypothetical protein